MGGDDSQKLLPWRGIYFPSGAQTSGSNYEINNVTETAVGISWVPPPLASLALASATARLGHFWKAQVGQFCRAPKHPTIVSYFWSSFRPRRHSLMDGPGARVR